MERLPTHFPASLYQKAMQMANPLLEAKGVSKQYAGNRNPTIANLNLRIENGEFIVIMGSSGSGKSTLLYLLSGLDELSDGAVYFRSESLQEKTEEERTRFRKQQLGFVFQHHHLIPSLSLLENILVPVYLNSADKKRLQKRAFELLENVGLDHLATRLPAQVSGGEQQRTAVLRAIINQPDLLMVDEPTGNLNSAHSEQVLSLLQSLHQDQQSILMVTHDIKSACRGDRIIYLKDGQIVATYQFDTPTYQERSTQLTAWLADLGW